VSTGLQGSRGGGCFGQARHMVVRVLSTEKNSPDPGDVHPLNCHFRQKRSIFHEFIVANTVKTLWI
jgi:hypothetical protein